MLLDRSRSSMLSSTVKLVVIASYAHWGMFRPVTSSLQEYVGLGGGAAGRWGGRTGLRWDLVELGGINWGKTRGETVRIVESCEVKLGKVRRR